MLLVVVFEFGVEVFEVEGDEDVGYEGYCQGGGVVGFWVVVQRYFDLGYLFYCFMRGL